MTTFIDLQGFMGNNKTFILKELAIIDNNNCSIPNSYLFKSPYSYAALGEKYKKQAYWIYKNYHGLSWYAGCIEYSEVSRFIIHLLQNSHCIFVKGYEKALWLKQFCGVDVINIETLNCPNLYSIITNYENQNNSLAQENVMKIKYWYNCNFK